MTKSTLDTQGVNFIIWVIVLLLIFFFAMRTFSSVPGKSIIEMPRKAYYLVSFKMYQGLERPYFFVLDYTVDGVNQMPITFWAVDEAKNYIAHLGLIGTVYNLNNLKLEARTR